MYEKGEREYQVPEEFRKYGRILAWAKNKQKSLAVAVLKDETVKKWIILGVGKLVNQELRKICSDTVQSIQMSRKKEDMNAFPLQPILEETATYCPTLFSILKNCTRSTCLRPNEDIVICTIVCILCKFRRSSMSLFQRAVSALLYASHAGTSVCHYVITGY